VKSGDPLFSIGQHFNLSVAELREANPTVGNTISVGQVLNIPARIRFAAGRTSTVSQGQVAGNSKHEYLLAVTAGQTLEVNLGTAPKTAKSKRTIKLTVYAVEALRARGPKEKGLVFATSHGTPFSGRNLGHYFLALCVKAGIPKIPFHSLRHTFASLLLS
jgi:hypothetical protein